MDIEKAIKELRESYELKHRQWAYNCLDVIKDELEKKDKVINEMAEYIDKITFVDEQGDYGCDFELLTNATCNYDDCKKCIKEYFTNKAENVGE